MDILESLNRIKKRLLSLSWEQNDSQTLNSSEMTDIEFSNLENELHEILILISNTTGEERETLNNEVQKFYEDIKVRFEVIKEKLEDLKNEHEERVQYIKAVNAYGKS